MAVDFSGLWNYLTPGLDSVPAAGVCAHSLQSVDELWFFKIDANGVNYGTELLAVIATDLINGAGQTWTVSGPPVDQTTYVVIPVTPDQRGLDGSQKFVFGDDLTGEESEPAVSGQYRRTGNRWRSNKRRASSLRRKHA